MNETPQDAWFYSREGERVGPVGFSDLVIKAKEGTLNPRLDLVWKHGMADWKPAGEIEGLYERRTTLEPESSPASPADPYASPDLQSMDSQLSGQENWPGMRRRSYLFMVILFPILLNIVMAAGSPMLTEQFGAEVFAMISLGSLVVLTVVGIVVGVRRLVNVGMSGWWYLGNFVPILNFWVGYRSFACPAGYAYHKKLDGIGIFLAIVYWLVLLLIVLAVAAMIAVMFGAIGDSELKERMMEAIRESQQTAPQP